MAEAGAKGLKGKRKVGSGGTVTARKRARRKPKPLVATGGEGRVVQGGRVVDVIDLMHRAGQIDSRQRMAAWRYRDAWEAASGGVPSQLDLSRAQYGGSAGMVGPAQMQLQAAQTVREAMRLLGAVDYRVVTAVCCEGQTIAGAAEQLLGGRATAGQVREMGGRLRLALSALADVWYPQGRSRIVSRVFAKEILEIDIPFSDQWDISQKQPFGGGVYEVEKGRVVHATSCRIYEKSKK